MVDSRHLENGNRHISTKKSSDFDEIWFTTADLQLDDSHVTSRQTCRRNGGHRQTDRQTDRHLATALFAPCVASCGKNLVLVVKNKSCTFSRHFKTVNSFVSSNNGVLLSAAIMMSTLTSFFGVA